MRLNGFGFGIGFVWKKHFFPFSAGTDLVEALNGAGELSIEAGFVAIEDVEPAGLVAQRTVGQGGLGGHVFERVSLGLLTDFVGNGGVFEDPDAHQTPAADDHGFDQAALGGGFGLIFGDEGIVEGVEALGGFAVKDDGVAEQAVDKAVARGGERAFGR